VEPTRRRGPGDTAAAGARAIAPDRSGPTLQHSTPERSSSPGSFRQSRGSLIPVDPGARGRGVLPHVRGGTRRTLRVALAVALLLHLPFIPNPLFAWIQVLLSVGDGEIADYDAGETIIPLDLDLLASDPVAENQAPNAVASAQPASDPGASPATPPAPAPAPPAPPAVASAEPKPPSQPKEKPDAGAGDAGEAPKPTPDTGKPKLRDPLAVAGAPGKLASKDPNVQVLIAGDQLRKHELGAWFGRILRTIPEWQTFFEDTPIDPIQDLNHMLIAGPQFRDSSKVVAVMDYRIPDEAIRSSVDVLVQRTNGEWLTDTPVPAARATADRAERIFALIPEKRLLVVLPVDQKDSLDQLKSLKSFNRSSGAGIVISMLTPANAFRNVYKLPKTLKWMRLSVTPTKDGGADLALTVGDGSAADAAEHAEELSRAINGVRRLDLGITKVEVIDEVKFTAEDDVMWTRLHVKEKQLKLIMGYVEQALKDQAEARKAKTKDKAPSP